MIAQVLCPNPGCGASFGVPEEKLGQAGRCPECDTGFILSDSAHAETMAYESERTSESDIPARLGRYEILRKLGRGGMGAVYLAHDTHLDRLVALKLPHASLRDKPEVQERFYREAKTAARFHHPNFCPIHEVGQFEGWNYLAMAYIEGETLASMIARDGPMPLRRAAAITRKLAQALQEAHDQKIVHRDLKPSNVMINRRRELIIMDFGLARREGTEDPELTRPGVVLGSPHYMAPEQVRADRDAIGPATDQYALGVMLYEMLTGRRPYVGAMMLVLGLIATSQPDPPSKFRLDLDPELEAICLKAIAREPADRYPSMSALVAALEAYLGRHEHGPLTSSGAAQDASRRDRGPASAEIQLAPEPKADLTRARQAAIDNAEDTGSAYHLAVEPVAAPPQELGDDPWSASMADVPPAKRTAFPKAFEPAARPRAVKRMRGGVWRFLADIMYVLICISILVAAGFFLVRWMMSERGSILIQPPGSAEVRIDGQIISPEDLRRPIELRIGEHELLVTQGDRIIASQKIEIIPGSNPTLRIHPGSRPPAHP